MNSIQAIVIAIIEGITEFLPISSTAHMIFSSTFFGIQEDQFVKIYQISIQFGAICSVVFIYWKKFFNFKKNNFHIKLFFAISPIIILGFFFNNKIEKILEKPFIIAIVLIIGGIILVFIDKIFKNHHILIQNEENLTIKKAIIIGLWQSLAIIPGTSRSAASIIGGMQQGLSRDFSVIFSFFLAVPTIFAVTCYSIFLKNWHYQGIEKKGFEIILISKENIINFIGGNVIAFLVALVVIKFFIKIIKRFGFTFWGIYRIISGILILIYLN